MGGMEDVTGVAGPGVVLAGCMLDFVVEVAAMDDGHTQALSNFAGSCKPKSGPLAGMTSGSSSSAKNASAVLPAIIAAA